MDYQLKPHPRPRLRAGLLAIFMVPLFISTVSWQVKAGGLVFWALMFGSYPVAWLREDRFEQQYVIGFVPLKAHKYRLKRIDALGLDTEEPVGILWVFIIGVGWLITFWVFDWLFPWLGGRYRLWFLTHSEKRILAWQGNDEESFHETVAQFEQATGLKCQRTNFNR
jgi:hypothetical protein